jgi:Fe-S-cluster-containing dehydrogenase component/Rieske Fe-S protein
MKATRYGIDDRPIFVIDPSRCIGCEACVQACAECGTHRGQSLIHLERIDRVASTQTAPMVCMHCEDPTCAQVCPADAIKQTEEGIVQSALKPRCIGCSNCVLACPFGVPKYVAEFDQMMKCDMCTDRTSEGYAPCARRCARARRSGTAPRGVPRHPARELLDNWLFGRQHVHTKVFTVVDDLAGGPLDALAAPPARGSTTPSVWRTDGRRTRADPPWKRDFPYEAAGEDEVTRREFARYLVAGAGVMAAGNLGIAAGPSCAPSTPANHERSIPLADVAVGDTYLFRYPTDADPAILLRLADREVVAFSQKCTHLGCVVYFEAEEDRWHCPCHEGNFEARPVPSSPGHRPRPLGRIDVEIRDDTIWALGYQP